ncbi:glycosyltransferase family 2 protein [Flavobacterium sp. LB2P84]|uniref:glycosyltransferase family 2 protein n=1 Tax=Flavobacterium yafengii TaxID=3041253 RepID=UPI0024A887F4|nr:glycosyltransferase family 2 protein [Flavobacterium yafengii]MDI6034446.1 glycosyltransferase family 2 protein [Flavobacterium yafengii]
MNPQVSIVISTYGRFNEIDLLLNSLVLQECKQSIFEVIIIDQNDKIDLSPIILKFENKLGLIYYKTDAKGLSKAKNKGIELAKGRIITFSDDDCTFYEDTISSAISYFESNPTVDVVYGRLYDKGNKKNIMREWSKKDLTLNKLNFHLNYSAVTCFTKVKTIFFDERLGVGAEIGLGEELDYIMQVLNLKLKIEYTSSISIWHPELNVNSMSKEKVYTYAYGLGAVFRKNFGFEFGIILLLSFGYQFLRLFISMFKLDFESAHKMILGVKGRVLGFILYK